MGIPNVGSGGLAIGRRPLPPIYRGRANSHLNSCFLGVFCSNRDPDHRSLGCAFSKQPRREPHRARRRHQEADRQSGAKLPQGRHFGVEQDQERQGEFDAGIGELADAATALDWLQTSNPAASQTWVAGFDFGAYIGMQLLMRRPETDGFISVSPPTNINASTPLVSRLRMCLRSRAVS